MLIVPTSLRKQWSQELHDKFSLPSMILEAGIYRGLERAGRRRPFEASGKAIICAYEFAARRAESVACEKTHEGPTDSCPVATLARPCRVASLAD